MVRPAPTVVGMSCTTLLIGKSASCSGATIIARNDDSGSGRYDPKRLVAVAPTDQPRHYRSTLSHVEIDLPDDPCRYTIAPNVLPNRGVLAEAGASERNVAMSATETIAVNERVLAADPLVELRPAEGVPGEAGYRRRPPAASVRRTSSRWCCRMSLRPARVWNGSASCWNGTAPMSRTA